MIDPKNMPLRDVKDPLFDEDRQRYYFASASVASANDCTGLEVTPPNTDAEVESYSQIYKTPLTKNGGNQHV
ncbi:MAG: hypothetical protein K6B40_06290 [Firmicutes bacterium]|nr:hypothetical protein [Bacillota bacterium]